MDSSNDLLRPLVTNWLEKIRLAVDYKKSHFQADADDAMRFYNGPHDFMYERKYANKSSAFSYNSDDDFPEPAFKMTCLVADTPIRMADGSEKPIQNILAGDIVVTHTGQHRMVLRTFKRNYSGSLVTLRLRGFPFPLTMTADHRMAVLNDGKLSWVRAENINCHDQMLVGWNRVNAEQSIDAASMIGSEVVLACGSRVRRPRTHYRSALNLNIPVSPELGRLIGFYLAEGSLFKTGVEFTFGSHKNGYANEVLSLVKKIFGVDGIIVSPFKHTVLRVKFGNCNLREFFRSLCPGKAGTKRVPAQFFQAGEETKLALILAWFDGDGHYSFKINRRGENVTQIIGTTVSAGLARDMTTLCLSVGMRTLCNVLKAYRGGNDRYTVHLSGVKAAMLFSEVYEKATAAGVVFKHFSDTGPLGCTRDVKEKTVERTDGVMVYDFEVEEDHSFLSSDVVSSNCNKVAEMVELFGPVLYHRNPYRQVNPRQLMIPPIEMFGNPNDPTPVAPPQGPGMPPVTAGQMVVQQFQQVAQHVGTERAGDKTRALVMSGLLNYTPNELDLKTESRNAIEEALIKGMGVLWTEIYYPKAGGKLIGTYYDSVDNLVIDPDMESIRDAKWIARRCIRPTWEAEKEFGLKEGSLRKGNVESFDSQASDAADADAQYNRARGLTNELVAYWKIYSKMGLGGRMRGIGEDIKALSNQLGDYVYLVVADTFSYPLNLPLDQPLAPGELQQRTQWPTPFWLDDDWPFTPVYFHSIPRKVWPMSHLKPALGELMFLNWCYSFLAGKVRTTSRDFIVVMKAAGEELRDTILHGKDLELIELESALGKTISEVVQWLQHPAMGGDIFKVLELVEHNFEKRVGLTELMYGETASQMRSASEADVKNSQLQVRPEDMAIRVEEAMTLISRKEGIASRWHLTAEDVQPILGDVGAQLWQQFVMSQSVQVSMELEYRIEAGSTRKPNKSRDAQNMNQAMQTLFQPLWQYAMQSGNVEAVNALITDWAHSIDLDPAGYLIKPPPPPPPGPPPGAPPGPPPPHGGPPPGPPHPGGTPQ